LFDEAFGNIAAGRALTGYDRVKLSLFTSAHDLRPFETLKNATGLTGRNLSTRNLPLQASHY
jgi:hypothetical protein